MKSVFFSIILLLSTAMVKFKAFGLFQKQIPNQLTIDSGFVLIL
jgi:hypothetical protein